ncbi:lanosterol 14-alpha-demethylase [Schizopora paradoxa]|uniref:Lanosterol 14-alpha-demethylase n=1 Tax=Schizopora paradoxa TaxID=27342 RepID=A0A0H2R4N5_9AGAM|nr:lanosterol 14-alpha-demethylase [Schizopora paradoxa]
MDIKSPSLFIVIGVLSTPALPIVLNVVWQLFGWKSRTLPPVVFHWIPFLGSAISYGTDPIRFLLRCREKYGDVFTFILFGRRMTVALGPKGNNFVTGGKVTQVSAEEAYAHLTTPVFGEGVVFDVPNEILMEQKKFVKCGLTIDHLRSYVGMIVDEVTNFLDTDPAFKHYQIGDMNSWGSFHVMKRLAEITILTAARTLQGKEVRGNMDKTFAQVYNDLDGGFTPMNLFFPNIPSAANRKRDRAQKTMSDFYVNIIRKRAEGKEHERDMISALMEQQYKSGKGLGEREVAHLMITLLMAGQHTSSSTAAWAFLRIAANPDVLDALYREQVENFGTGREGEFEPLTYESLRNLPVLDAVIRETLRMHPPIHSIIRKVTSDLPVPLTLAAPSGEEGLTYVVPKGHFVMSSPAATQMDPRTWKDSSVFDPNRWLDSKGVAAQALKTYADEHGEKVDYGFGAVSKGTESPYQPFGAGRHRCIGEQFAYLQIGTILATFVRKLDLRLETNFPENNYHTMITLPKDPCNISYRRRN